MKPYFPKQYSHILKDSINFIDKIACLLKLAGDQHLPRRQDFAAPQESNPGDLNKRTFI